MGGGGREKNDSLAEMQIVQTAFDALAPPTRDIFIESHVACAPLPVNLGANSDYLFRKKFGITRRKLTVTTKLSTYYDKYYNYLKNIFSPDILHHASSMCHATALWGMAGHNSSGSRGNGDITMGQRCADFRQVLKQQGQQGQRRARVRSLDWSRCGSYVLQVQDDGMIRVYDVNKTTDAPIRVINI